MNSAFNAEPQCVFEVLRNRKNVPAGTSAGRSEELLAEDAKISHSVHCEQRSRSFCISLKPYWVREYSCGKQTVLEVREEPNVLITIPSSDVVRDTTTSNLFCGGYHEGHG